MLTDSSGREFKGVGLWPFTGIEVSNRACGYGCLPRASFIRQTSVRRADHSLGGVLPSVVCLRVVAEPQQ